MNTRRLKTEKGVTIITSEIEIDKPKEKVWGVLSIIGEIDKFHPLVKKSCATTGIISGLGARRHCELLPMGQMEEEVVELIEGKTIVMEVVGGKMLPPYRFMKGRIDLMEINNRTRVTFSFSYQLKYGVLGWLINVLLIKPQFKKAPSKYVKGLKNYVESL